MVSSFNNWDDLLLLLGVGIGSALFVASGAALFFFLLRYLRPSHDIVFSPNSAAARAAAAVNAGENPNLTVTFRAGLEGMTRTERRSVLYHYLTTEDRQLQSLPNESRESKEEEASSQEAPVANVAEQEGKKKQIITVPCNHGSISCTPSSSSSKIETDCADVDLESNINHQQQHDPSVCSICLSPFEMAAGNHTKVTNQSPPCSPSSSSVANTSSNQSNNPNINSRPGPPCARQFRCRHLFHLECLLEWTSRWNQDHCPYCRSELLEARELVQAAQHVLGVERVAELKAQSHSQRKNNI